MKGIIFHIPFETAITPVSGQCLANRWWAVHPEKGLAFYMRKALYLSFDEEPSPQCNPTEWIARRLTSQMYPDHETQHIPVVFMLHAIREMQRIHKELTAKRKDPKKC